MQTDVLIVGAGPSGLFTAFQAGMLGMSSIIVDILDTPGGQCSTLYPEKPIYDIPAYPEIIASQLVEKLLEQIKPFDTQILLSQQVNSLQMISCSQKIDQKNEKYHSTNNIFQVGTSTGNIINAKAVVIAAGSGAFGPNKPPLEGIESYEGKSVFYFIPNRNDFKNKKVLIAGGGDSALDWAISLSEIADVSIVHRRAKFRAASSTVKKLYDLNSKGLINIITNYQLKALKGENGYLSDVILVDLDGQEKSVQTDILLPFFGLKQDLGPILDFELNIKNHHIAVSLPYYQTNIDGIYAVGDVASYGGKLKLILTSFAEAASAMHHAYSRVFDGKALHFEYSTTKGIFESS